MMGAIEIVITDVTRMGLPYVCVAGITDDGRTIRPVFEHDRIEEKWLYQNGKAVIRPFAKIGMDVISHRSCPPHCEDWVIQPTSRRLIGILAEIEKHQFCEKIVDPSIEAIFGADIHQNPGHYIRENEGCRSLGTIHPQLITQVMLYGHADKMDFRIEFLDATGCLYDLAITDLSFRSYIDQQRREQVSINRICSNLVQYFHDADVYLRIGLGRPTWNKHPHCCFLQVNGIYSFPDYLNGKCFADFVPQTEQVR
jgi:hypothetical protein